jgi:hypothetical protein
MNYKYVHLGDTITNNKCKISPPEQKKNPKEKETNNTQKKSTVEVCPRAFNSSGSSVGGKSTILHTVLCCWIFVLTDYSVNHLADHEDTAEDRMIMISI